MAPANNRSVSTVRYSPSPGAPSARARNPNVTTPHRALPNLLAAALPRLRQNAALGIDDAFIYGPSLQNTTTNWRRYGARPEGIGLVGLVLSLGRLFGWSGLRSTIRAPPERVVFF